MKALDRWMEASTRRAARTVSRRSFLARLGGILAGGAALPLLPVSRAGGAETAPTVPDDSAISGPQGDPGACEYWRHCAIDGFLCSCCGGSHTACPPGTEMAPVTWIGTCRNPSDGRDYIISYNDCCGKDYCGRCLCNRNEGDLPVYFPPKSNDINWCMAGSSTVYNCSTAIVVGLATRRDPE